MEKNRKNKPFFPSVTITDIGAEGKAIARVNDIVVFTTHVIPGDIVDIQVTKKRKKYYEGRVTNLVKPSSDRIDAFCEHFGKCGGCKWQYLPYNKQLFYKQKQVLDQLTRIGHLKLPEISPILASKKDKFYRNKLEFSFSNKRWLSEEEIKNGKENISKTDVLGFHVPQWFDKVININKCWLQPEPSNSIRNFIREYALEHKLEFFDIREHKGFLRNLIIRTSSTGENMIILSFYKEDKEKRETLLEAIVQKFPELNSVLYVINQKPNDTLSDQDIKTYKGTDYIFEEMEGLKFKIGPKSFYQTNSDQAYELYKIARNFAGLTGKETVYDLYTGTGTIANFVAKNAKNVIGIEYIPEAIENAKENSEINNINNTAFYAGDMKDIFNSSFIKENGQPDVVITDPPRAGMHEDVIKTLLKVSPKRIVYISCNPATQARDIGIMSDYYKIIKIQPVDMFPHTHHVENVVLLDKI